MDEAADRLQLYDASGSWSDFNVAVRPALAERQNKRAEKADIKVRARRLEEETRAWTVLPEKESDDEYDDDDDDAPSRDACSMAWRCAPRRWRWRRSGNAKGGRTPSRGRFGSCRKMLPSGWRSRDADKNFCSVAASVLFMLSRVASLASPVRSTPSTRAPSQVSSTARPGKGFTTIPASPRIRTCRMCAAGSSNASTRCGRPFIWVLVSWKRGRSVRNSTARDAALLKGARWRGKKARQETLKRVLKNAKTFVRDLSSEVLRAKELWSEEDFAADAELVYAAHTLHRLNELKVVAEAEQERGLEAKRKLIREAKRFQGVWCRACRHKCMDQQATHCPTCGVRFTSKGVIAVGDIGSENFQEQTRESRASLADRLAERASLESRPGTAGLIEAPAEEVQPRPSVTFSLETDESTNPLQRSSIESSRHARVGERFRRPRRMNLRPYASALS